VAISEISPPASPSAKPAFSVGIVNPLQGAFKRWDGLALIGALWPRMSRFESDLDYDDSAAGKAIGMVLNYVSGGEGGAAAGELDVALLTGPRFDAPVRYLRLATYTTVADPPGPLVLVAKTAPNTLKVRADARFKLNRKGADLLLEVSHSKGSWSRQFVRVGPAWAARPRETGFQQP
jgi:hypothetical protein